MEKPRVNKVPPALNRFFKGEQHQFYGHLSTQTARRISRRPDRLFINTRLWGIISPAAGMSFITSSLDCNKKSPLGSQNTTGLTRRCRFRCSPLKNSDWNYCSVCSKTNRVIVWSAVCVSLRCQTVCFSHYNKDITLHMQAFPDLTNWKPAFKLFS